MTKFLTSKIVAASSAFAMLSFLACGEAFAQDATETDTAVVEAEAAVVVDENGQPVVPEVLADEDSATEGKAE
jgi:hypothetical protein